MKNVTRWTSIVSKLCLGGLLLVSQSNAQAGIISVLKDGRPDGKGAPAPVEAETVREWQRVGFVGSGKVRQLTGQVEILTGVNQWSDLSTGTILHPGDMIRTHENSRAIVQMTASGSLIAVTPKTVMRLTEFEQGWDRSILSGTEEARGYAVRSLRGGAEYKDASNKWQLVSVNSVLPVGTKVRTQSATTMDLFHAGTGSFLRLNPSIELVLDPTAQYSAKLVAVQTDAVLKGIKTAQLSK